MDVLRSKSEVFIGLDFRALENTFGDLADAIFADPEDGKRLALESISRMRGVPRHAELVRGPSDQHIDARLAHPIGVHEPMGADPGDGGDGTQGATAGLADRCEIQVSYAIGVAEPVSVMVDSYGTGQAPDAELTRAVRKVFDLTPRGIISRLELRTPVFKRTAAYGHFGREESGFTWERTDMFEELQRALG